MAMSRIDGLAFFFVYVFMTRPWQQLWVMSTPLPLQLQTGSTGSALSGLRDHVVRCWGPGVFVPALGWLVEAYGWRPAALFVGVFIAVLGSY